MTWLYEKGALEGSTRELSERKRNASIFLLNKKNVLIGYFRSYVSLYFNNTNFAWINNSLFALQLPC